MDQPRPPAQRSVAQRERSLLDVVTREYAAHGWMVHERGTQHVTLAKRRGVQLRFRLLGSVLGLLRAADEVYIDVRLDAAGHVVTTRR